MKILGKNADGAYIAILSHAEVEKVVDKYYGHLPKLEAGSEFDLSQGYNFRSDIASACRDMAAAMKTFERSRATLLKFANMVGELETTGSAA
jgi:hypothetical protein